MWSELISAVLGAVAMLLVAWLKPEWLIGPLINWLARKLNKKQANIVSNALGLLLINTGVFAILKLPDNPQAEEIAREIARDVQELKKALEQKE